MEHKIKKGEHYSNGLPRLHFGIDTMVRTVKFDKSCYYFHSPEMGINKLFGFSYGHHHKDSIRIGWKPNDYLYDTIELYAYVYNKGVRTIIYMYTVPVEKEFSISITVYKKGFEIDINTFISNKLYKNYFEKPKFTCGYYLKPYFGGKVSAPNDMTITIKSM